MTKKLSSLDISNYITEKKIQHYEHKFKNETRYFTVLELVKLVYLAYGWYIGLTGERLFDDDTIEAWPYGPVPVNVYKESKKFRDTKRLDRKEFDEYKKTTSYKKLLNNDNLSDEEKKIKDFLDTIIKKYEGIDPFVLSDMTHENGTPWYKTIERNNSLYEQIPDKFIKDHYKQLNKLDANF